jgi:transcriptional regulator with XRE-family HTH domain
MAGVRHLGDYIREQRRDSNVSLRQLAKLAGVSNPYLSQIERGLRKPSAEILQQIAKALRISAEALYIQAGILEQREGSRIVPDAVQADESLTERQKHVLLEIYESFRKENAGLAAGLATAQPPGAPEPLATAPAVQKPAATKPAPPKKAARKTSPKKSVPTPDTSTAAGGTA